MRVAWRSPRVFLPLTVFGMFAAAVALQTQAGARWWPGCVLYRWTGLYCPGCGNTRAVLALLEGDVPRALGYNFVGILVVLGAGVFSVWYGLLSFWENRWIGPAFSNRTGWIFLGVAVSWMVLRNLPWGPFVPMRP